MGCAIGTVRYILFFFNFLLALAGLGILTLGVLTAHAKGNTINDVVHGQLTTPAIVFAIVGACIFVFAFFGCCGALRESHCMICTYAVLLLVTLFLLQVAVAVLAYTYKNQTEEAVNKHIEQVFNRYTSNTTDKEWVDNFQREMQCCGTESPHKPWDLLGIPVPQSCYPKDATETYSQGCIQKLVDYVESSLTDIAKIAIIVAAVQVVGIIFSLCLASSIRRSELRGYA